ncbi:MAG: hypothetical protein WCQ87_10440 [Parabacteroides sp.]
MATKKPRYMISVDDDMFNEIEDFRFENRFPTSSEATTELIRLGLKQIKKERERKKMRGFNTSTPENRENVKLID